MRVTLVRSGGFSGVRRTWSVDTERLPADKAQWLKLAVADSKLATVEVSKKEPSNPDGFQFELSVEDGGARNSVMFDERSAPPSLASVIAFIRSEPVTEGAP